MSAIAATLTTAAFISQAHKIIHNPRDGRCFAAFSVAGFEKTEHRKRIWAE